MFKKHSIAYIRKMQPIIPYNSMTKAVIEFHKARSILQDMTGTLEFGATAPPPLFANAKCHTVDGLSYLR